MDTDGAGPRRGTRDNGLRCASYVAIADLDPRVADALLEALRDNGIAAYAGPTPAAAGGFGELQLPERPIDRLYVDELQQSKARTIVDHEKPEPSPAPQQAAPLPASSPSADDDIDFDAAWAQLLTSLQPGTTASEPVRAAAPEPIRAPDYDDDEVGYDPADHDHFEPPPPPPLPRLRRVTAAAIASIVLGLLILASNLDDGGFTWLAIAAIIGGVGSLVWHMRQGPPNDDGWDDGAVV